MTIKRLGTLWLFASVAVVVVIVGLAVPVGARAENGGTKGQQFILFGGATDTLDPGNATNETLLFDTTGDARPGVFRKINPGTTIEMLKNQVQVKYFFVNRTCVGGSPRIQLGIDRDGDGQFDGNAFGYLGDKAFGGDCAPGTWVFEDMTNAAPKWDLGQFGGPQTITWEAMEAFFRTNFPQHKVVNGVLVDDSCGFQSSSCGVVHFDNVVIGNRSINDHGDTTGQ